MKMSWGFQGGKCHLIFKKNRCYQVVFCISFFFTNNFFEAWKLPSGFFLVGAKRWVPIDLSNLKQPLCLVVYSL